MKLPTDDEQEQGRRRASNRIAHPCFPCIFIECNKVMMSSFDGVLIADRCFNQCSLRQEHEIIHERCPGYYHSDIKKDIKNDS